MSNYRIKIQYDGSRYRGWQRQQGEKNTIQGRIEQVLSKQMEFPVTIDGAGRTDAGVHAKEQVANFRLNTEKTTQQLQDVLNEYLPEDIRIRGGRTISQPSQCNRKSIRILSLQKRRI